MIKVVEILTDPPRVFSVETDLRNTPSQTPITRIEHDEVRNIVTVYTKEDEVLVTIVNCPVVCYRERIITAIGRNALAAEAKRLVRKEAKQGGK